MLWGAGVALALPWLESLSPRQPRAQARELPRRFLPIYLPNGAHEFWRPATSGRGDEWQLSSILDPFGAALKAKLNVVTNLENGSVFRADGTAHVEPSHSQLGGAWLTCVDADAVRGRLVLDEANGISVDQVLAQHDSFRGKTALDSLQVGLSTPFSSCDGEPCSSSRSVSWASATQPMYKLVDPLEIFNRIVGGTRQPDPTGPAAIEAQKRVALKKSVLDAVLENAQRTRARLGVNDQRRMDGFLESVRGVEKRVVGVSAGMGGVRCAAPASTDMPRVEQSAVAPRQTTETYDKGRHADAMNDLIVMAFECDVTRVISYMLEDERSEFTYDNVQERAFTADELEARRVARAPNTISPSTTAATCSPPSPGGTSARWQTSAESSTPSRRRPGSACSTTAWSSWAPACTAGITRGTGCRSRSWAAATLASRTTSTSSSTSGPCGTSTSR